MLYLSKTANVYIKVSPKPIDKDYLEYRKKMKKYYEGTLPIEPLLGMYKYYMINPEEVEPSVADLLRSILKEEIGKELEFIDQILQPI